MVISYGSQTSNLSEEEEEEKELQTSHPSKWEEPTLPQQEQKVYFTKPIEDPSEFSSAVSIIVPFHGQYELCSQLLESIFQFTRSNYYELCVVDDASANESYIESIEKRVLKFKTQLMTAKFIRTNNHLGFGGAASLGFQHASHPYIVIINSDCRIEDPNWLRGMGETLLSLRSKNVRMVSPKMNNPVNGSLKQKGIKGVPCDDEILQEDDYLSLVCVMSHRDLYSRIGGFIKPYPIGYYEDEEIAYRMRKHGFRQAVSGKSWIHHEGEKTMKSVLRKNPSLQQVIEENYERCMEDIKKLS